MQPRLMTHARAAALETTTSSAVRPDGNASSTVRTNSGSLSGARFWKKKSPVAPFGQRFMAIGRSKTPSTAPSATDR